MVESISVVEGSGLVKGRSVWFSLVVLCPPKVTLWSVGRSHFQNSPSTYHPTMIEDLLTTLQGYQGHLQGNPWVANAFFETIKSFPSFFIRARNIKHPPTLLGIIQLPLMLVKEEYHQMPLVVKPPFLSLDIFSAFGMQQSLGFSLPIPGKFS